MVTLQVHQNGGDDLRVLMADQLGHRGRIHPAQALDARDVAALHDAVDQHAGLVVAQRTFQHATHVGVGIMHQRALLRGLLMKTFQNLLDMVLGRVLGPGHHFAQSLYLLRCQVLEDFGCRFLAQGEQQHGGITGAGFIETTHAGLSGLVPLTQLRTTVATAVGSVRAS